MSENKMMIEAIFVLPIYIAIFVIYFRFKPLIKRMAEANDILSDLLSDTSETNRVADCASKREFLLEKLKNGEQISNSKTPWTVERLEKASDKVIEKLYDKYQNPLPVKINKQEALEMGKTVCPVVIEMYAEGLENIIDHFPYISEKYTINVEKLKRNISTNKLFCDNLAIKIGSKMIEKMGENSAIRIGVSLAAMTWDAVEKVKQVDKKLETKDAVSIVE